MGLKEAVRDLPPLLVLLETRSRSSEHGGASKDPGLPLDADALEIAAQIRDRLREWCTQIRAGYDRDSLVGSFAAWWEQFASLISDGRMPDLKLAETTHIVESWVRMITNKYVPPTIVEWKSPCPKCHTRIDHFDSQGNKVGEYFSSIRVNITNQYAECSACGETFTGRDGLAELRLLTNIAEQLEHGEPVHKSALRVYMQYHGVSEVA